MANQSQSGASRLSFSVSTAQRPDFKGKLVAHVFDANGTLIERAPVNNGKLELKSTKRDAQLPRVLIAPEIENEADCGEDEIGVERLLKLGAYEPVLRRRGGVLDRIVIPGQVLDIWPFCFCWVRGRVIRASDNLAVCNARVHICEVDRLPWWILRLPDRDALRLRDDLLEIIKNPPIPVPQPPDPIDGPRFIDPGSLQGFNPQPDPPIFDPQVALRFAEQAAEPGIQARALAQTASIDISAELQSQLLSNSAATVRNALSENWRLVAPWLCIWPHWWWRFRCDEIAVVDTDGYGNFERLIIYPCQGDHPDLYFWVEYDLGSGFETVYRPHIGCNTYWNYDCGTEVTIRITDPRVPACDPEPPLQGKQVVVKSIGRTVAVREVGGDGLANGTAPFGHALEPRVDFGREALIASGIPYYRWSYRRRTGPDGTTPDVGPWTPMTRSVYRHYKDGTAYPSDVMGPMPTTGPGAAPEENLFRIRPVDSPSGEEWVVLNERVDLATAYFDTHTLPGNPEYTDGVGWSDDLAAGLYELKLELFDNAGNLVHDWAAQGIDLRITDQDAPFGTGTITTSPAPVSNQLISAGHIDGFRMLVRVDNNRCSAQIHPIAGDVTPDADCGFHLYDSGDDAGLSFTARHPNEFATYQFGTGRGTGSAIAIASTSGTVGQADGNGFGAGAGFLYAKDVPVAAMLGACPNAAFWERLDVRAMATNGYSTLTGYNAADNAAFALAQPCPDHGPDDV